MRAGVLEGRTDEWVRVVVARDADTADVWRNALEASRIGAEVRLEDALEALPGTSTLPGALPRVHPFAYGIYVPAASRDCALRVLIDAGWNGRTGRTGTGAPADARTVLVGAGLALTAALAIVCARLALG